MTESLKNLLSVIESEIKHHEEDVITPSTSIPSSPNSNPSSPYGSDDQKSEGEGIKLSRSGSSHSQQQQQNRAESHLASEKRRRANINDGFELLRSVVPQCQPCHSKAEILKKAVLYIRCLTEKNSSVFPCSPSSTSADGASSSSSSSPSSISLSSNSSKEFSQEKLEAGKLAAVSGNDGTKNRNEEEGDEDDDDDNLEQNPPSTPLSSGSATTNFQQGAKVEEKLASEASTDSHHQQTFPTQPQTEQASVEPESKKRLSFAMKYAEKFKRQRDFVQTERDQYKQAFFALSCLISSSVPQLSASQPFQQILSLLPQQSLAPPSSTTQNSQPNAPQHAFQSQCSSFPLLPSQSVSTTPNLSANSSPSASASSFSMEGILSNNSQLAQQGEAGERKAGGGSSSTFTFHGASGEASGEARKLLPGKGSKGMSHYEPKDKTKSKHKSSSASTSSVSPSSTILSCSTVASSMAQGGYPSLKPTFTVALTQFRPSHLAPKISPQAISIAPNPGITGIQNQAQLSSSVSLPQQQQQLMGVPIMTTIPTQSAVNQKTLLALKRKLGSSSDSKHTIPSPKRIHVD